MTDKTLKDLMKPFAPNEIGKLPKPTKAQTQEVKSNFKAGIRCKDCGAWHHPKVVHLDYVGHAPLTKRLLEVDPAWDWQPLAFREGLPAFDATGGLWIKLTVLGVTRLGYGNAPAKGEAGNREKEVIGDALRNAGMRFGMALNLWHKGELYIEEIEVSEAPPTVSVSKRVTPLKGQRDTGYLRETIDRTFVNPDEDMLEKCLTWLEKEKAPKDIMEYYQTKATEFYNLQQEKLQENK